MHATVSEQVPRSPVPESPGGPEDALAAGFVRTSRQFRALLGPDAASLMCLGVIAWQGPVRVSAIAAELVLDISTTSRHVAQLERAGLLARQPDPADRRAALLTLTPAGQARLQDFRQRRARLLRTATRSWPERDLASLTTLLHRLADDLGAIHEAEEPEEPEEPAQ